MHLPIRKKAGREKAYHPAIMDPRSWPKTSDSIWKKAVMTPRFFQRWGKNMKQKETEGLQMAE